MPGAKEGPRVVVVIVDGLPVELADDVIPNLPFLGEGLPHRAAAVSCFPSTTGPAYFPFLAGCTPGRANIPGIRWSTARVPRARRSRTEGSGATSARTRGSWPPTPARRRCSPGMPGRCRARFRRTCRSGASSAATSSGQRPTSRTGGTRPIAAPPGSSAAR